MGKGKKPFIDRKNALTFQLVHRSQHDPLVTDENAPQRVLVEANAHQPRKQQNSEEQELDVTKRREEQRKYGILYDDDYNYLQHLKKPEQEVVWEYVENPNQTRKRVDDGQVTAAPKLNLPSSVFASEFEEEEGMLNKAALCPGPRPDWDPDIVATLDDDFEADDDGDNELDDDFVLKAMAESPSDDEDDNDDDEDEDDEEDECSSDGEQDFGSDFDGSENDSELMDRLGPLMAKNQKFDDNKSRFSEYSISSSVMHRNEQLTLLDERFERFYATYDDPELGDLSLENIEGSWHQKHPYVLNCYRKLKKGDEIEDYNKEWDKERVKKYETTTDGADDDEELVNVDVTDDKTKKWDCESILSTYSNIYNHPKLIDEPKRRSQSLSKSQMPQKIEIDAKTNLPMNTLRNTGHYSGLTVKAIAELDHSNAAVSADAGGPKSLCAKSVLSTLSVLSIRPKDETPEEKHERKRLLKEYRNERRIEKKANALAFKEEKKRQTHVQINKNTNQLGSKIV